MVQANVPWLTLWERPQSPLWDDRATPQKETRADIALRAFREAVAGLRKELGDGTATWTWGRVHQLTLRHAFHSRQSIAPFFDVGPFPHAGTPTSLLKGEFDHTEVLPGPIRNGPGTRFVMEPGGRTAAVLDGGNFGWPGTPGYGAMNAKWRAGELIDVPLTDDAVRAATALRVQAVPADRRSSR
jgi:penicillin amidase